jgi:polyisoprenoid-binding protein YceI
MMKFKLLFALLLISILFSSCKQNPKIAPPDMIKSETKNLVSSYGPTRMVRSVKQAKNGDILIASYTGVWRYDGKLFTNITTAISSPSFWDVLEDRKGNLWIGTKDSGIYCYPSDSLGTGGKYFLHYTTQQGLASNMALHLYEDRAGNIWFSIGDGATKYDGKTFQHFTTNDGLPKDGVNTFMEDKSGKLWIGTRSDACYFDGKTFTVFKNKAGKPFYNVWSFVEDKKGDIWFGGSIIKEKKGSTIYLDGAPGLWRYDGSNYTKVSGRSASAIMEDKLANIWTTGAANPVAVSDWKLLRYDQNSLNNEKPTVTEIASINKMLCMILEANDGSIWFGSGNGVYRWDGKVLTNFQRSEDQVYRVDNNESLITWKGSMKLSSMNKHVGSVSISKGELWVENSQLVGGEIAIDMNSIEYGDKKDKNTPVQHLKSPDYFDVKKFPTANIVITKIDSASANTFNITGDLTIKSETHPVSFPATITIQNGIINASATLTIDRTAWGITYRSQKFYDQIADQTVSDEIEFEMKIVAKNKLIKP